MAIIPQEVLEKLFVRGFEPADGYDPLCFVECHNQTFDTYYSEQIMQDIPYHITELQPLGMMKSSVVGLDKTVWFSKVSAGSDSTPAGACGIRVVGGTHSEGGENWGDVTVYFLDENGNTLGNSFFINMAGINDASFAPAGNMTYLVLCYRTDITPNQLQFGISYNFWRYMGYPPSIDDMRLLSDRAVHLGTQMVGVPNEPFLSWYEQNKNSPWYSPSSQVPDLTEGGGGGSLFRQSIDVPFPPLPPFEICNSDFIRLYNLTPAQLTDLGNYLWSDNFFDNIIKNWTSPLENIISLSVVPLIAFDGSNATIQIGNANTGVSAKRLSNSRYQRNMGVVNIKEMYRNFADYSPFQRLKIYLPYIGVRELNPDDYMNGSIEVLYQIDVFTGVCVAHLMAHKKNKNYVVDTYNGNITMQIPITGANYMSAFQASLNGLVANATGNILGGAMQGMNIKPSYEKSGTLTGQNGRLGVKYPYVFFDTPQFKAPKGFKDIHGYISNLSVIIGESFGYNEVSYINLDDLTATDNEKQELRQILEAGVFV